MKPTTTARMRCVYSTIELRSIPGTTSPLQNGQPWKPEPAGPQPRPESETRTTPPTRMRTKVATSVASASFRTGRPRLAPYTPRGAIG